MKELILVILIIAMKLSGMTQENYPKFISKNGMEVSWHYNKDRIYFKMSAPTDGWLAIGFNSTTRIEGTYLIMGNVINGKANVVEHFTLSPGNYKTISSLGATAQLEEVKGSEESNKTIIEFSLPIKAWSKYQKDLTKGIEYTMIIAFSQEDDFQHHSSMRTAVNINL